MELASGPRKRFIDSLAPELIEMIMEDVDLGSIRSIRLTCKSVCRCTYRFFCKFFKTLHTDLTLISLERLHLITSHPILGSVVQSLTVLAIVYDTSKLDCRLRNMPRCIVRQNGKLIFTDEPRASPEVEEMRQGLDELRSELEKQTQIVANRSDIQLLTAALSSLRGLATLSMEATVVQKPGTYIATESTHNWRPVWIRATQVYRTVTLAVARSGIAIDSVHFYKTSLRCSVPLSDIYAHMSALEEMDFAQTAQRIRSISLSISTQAKMDQHRIAQAQAILSREPELDADSKDSRTAKAQEKYASIAQLLKPMLDLESLDLHLYKIRTAGLDYYAQLFTSIANDVALPSLRHCSFRGLQCTEKSLLRFLNTHDAIETLELHAINLTSGSWGPVFAYLCTMSALQKVCLYHIGRSNERISLASKHPSNIPNNESWQDDDTYSYPCAGGLMVYARTFSREDFLRERFEFAKTPDGPAMGSPASFFSLQRLTFEYGPSGYA